MTRIPTWCMSCKVTTPHEVAGERRSVTNRPFVDMVCSVCGVQKTEMGRLENLAERAAARNHPVTVSRTREPVFPMPQRPRFIQAGCQHCRGALVPDPYEKTGMRCIACSRVAA